MAEWMKTSLIDIVKLIGGGTPKTTKSEYWEEISTGFICQRF